MRIKPPTIQSFDGLTPVWQRNERHGHSIINIVIYQSENNRYTYSIQCKLCSFIRVIFPHQLESDFSSRLEAEKSAIQLLYSWTKDFRNAKKHLKTFDLLAVGQQELFPELNTPD